MVAPTEFVRTLYAKLGFSGELALIFLIQCNFVGTGVPDGPFQRQSNFYKQMLDFIYAKP